MTEKLAIQCMLTSALTALTYLFFAWVENDGGEPTTIGKIIAAAFFLSLFLTAFFALMAIWSW